MTAGLFVVLLTSCVRQAIERPARVTELSSNFPHGGKPKPPIHTLVTREPKQRHTHAAFVPDIWRADSYLCRQAKRIGRKPPP